MVTLFLCIGLALVTEQQVLQVLRVSMLTAVTYML